MDPAIDLRDRTIIEIPPVPPQRKGLKLLGAIKEQSVMGFFDNLRDTVGSYASIQIPDGPSVVINDAEAARVVMLAGNTKGSPVEFFRFVKEGVFLNEGEAHDRQRDIAAPSFAPRNHADIVTQMTEATQEMLHSWQQAANDNKSVRPDKDLPKLAFKILLRGLFHEAHADIAEEMERALTLLFEKAAERLFQPFKIPASIIYASPNQYSRARKVLFEAAGDLIARRRADLKKSGFEHENDLLSQLVKNFGTSKKDHEILCHEIITYLVAGHETTGQALTHALIQLVLNPEALARVTTEVDRILDGRDPTINDVRALVDTGRAVDEALRVKSPVVVLRRKANDDIYAPLDETDQSGKPKLLFIPKDHLVTLSPWAMHYDMRYWGPNANRFDLDNFSREAVSTRNKGAYFPFAAGPRNCIGAHFARTEMIVALAMIVSRFEITIPDAAKINPRFAITLHTDRPVNAYPKVRGGFRIAA